MSRFAYNPITRELVNVNPRAAVIPDSAFALNDPPIIARRRKSTSPLLIGLMITFIIILILAVIYVFWLWFIREEGESPIAVFDWLTGN